MKDYSSIVIFSSVKFLRNLSGFEFPSMLSSETGKKVLNKLADNILCIDESFKLYKMKTLPELDRNIMHEKKLISNALMQAEEFGAVILSGDEEISIMLNESDHIVETCKKKGLNLIAAYDRLNVVDNSILSKLDIAYDDSLGFLTSNINQVGTGLVAQISLFLPALTITGKLNNVISEIEKQGIGIQSFSDGNSEYNNYICTISNKQTIGKRESDYIIKLTELAIKISELEIRARAELLSQVYVDEITDRVYRAWGIITNCYKISAEEAQKLLGELKMGVALDLLRFKDMGFIENLSSDILPYTLTKISGSTISVAELNKYRAKFLGNILKQKRIK